VIAFGTDGWRGLIAEDFTFANVSICSQAVADYIKHNPDIPNSLIVGYDTRFLSKEFADLVCQVMVSNNIKVYMTEVPTPTPVITYMIKQLCTGGGVIITASHNPYAWNGFKFKSSDGGSASQEIINTIESYILDSDPKNIYINNPMPTEMFSIIDAKQEYVEHVNKLINVELIKQSGLKVLVDNMFGSGSGYLSEILSGGPMVVSEIHSEINPNFPTIKQPEPIEDNLNQLASMLRLGNEFDIGLALDGDADRLGVIDENGIYVSTLQSFSLLVYYFLEVKNLKGPIVKSVTNSQAIDKLGARNQVQVYETPVGFKHLGLKMLQTGALLAGEESGGFAFSGSVPERDGILSALFLLEFLAVSKKTCSNLLIDLYSLIGPLQYSRKDIPLNAFEMDRIRSFDVSAVSYDNCPFEIINITTIDGLKITTTEGWVSFRLSGTEPLLRIYSEGTTLEIVDELISFVSQFLQISVDG
jgi:alpha-D-glucose phosphate-specific phosphoglucomutase